MQGVLQMTSHQTSHCDTTSNKTQRHTKQNTTTPHQTNHKDTTSNKTQRHTKQNTTTPHQTKHKDTTSNKTQLHTKQNTTTPHQTKHKDTLNRTHRQHRVDVPQQIVCRHKKSQQQDPKKNVDTETPTKKLDPFKDTNHSCNDQR